MDSSHRLKRKDTTKGPPLRILSLDGGGVRGYSMLILLQELMHKTFNETEGRAPKRHEIPKPCDYFDLIAGTGTGGLIAIMLGRLRLDLETCKQVYIRMTRKVFETDKTVFGMPYKSTLFKASKLEEAIRECVREHTVHTEEGNDGTAQGGREGGTPMSERNRRQSISSSISSGYLPMSPTSSTFSVAMRWGNANASLYDARENRTKTAVTAVYKDTSPKSGSAVLLRSYDSRVEPSPEFSTIWQAGRATSAIGLAFKPIQIGQSVFIDEGAGRYNPAPQIMDEAAVNEWPGREVGAFVSVGTGKRPSGTGNNKQEWWEGFIGGTAGDYADARRRLINKIEGCEETHQYMRSEHLSKRGVNPDNYYRLNVEVGVGEFGMNEWSRVADISTNTRVYLAKPEVKSIIESAAAKMARIERSKRRHSAYTTVPEMDAARRSRQGIPSPPNPLAVELPGDDGSAFHSSKFKPPPRIPSADDKFAVLSPHDVPPSAQRRSAESRRTDDPRSSNGSIQVSPRRSHESGRLQQPPPSQSHQTQGPPPSLPPRADVPPPAYTTRTEAPPRPPKTPIQTTGQRTPPLHANFVLSPISPETPQSRFQRQNTVGGSPYVVSPQTTTGTPQQGQPHTGQHLYTAPQPQQYHVLPYPDDDGPPPAVNMATRPRFVQR